MPEKPPADRTVTAPSDAAPRTAEARSADALLKHIGGLLQRRPWYQLPRLLATGSWWRSATSCARRICTTPRSRRSRNRRSRRDLDPALREERTIDGTYNDLQYPDDGRCGRRFGRNVPLEHTFPDTANLLMPSPRSSAAS